MNEFDPSKFSREQRDGIYKAKSAFYAGLTSGLTPMHEITMQSGKSFLYGAEEQAPLIRLLRQLEHTSTPQINVSVVKENPMRSWTFLGHKDFIITDGNCIFLKEGEKGDGVGIGIIKASYFAKLIFPDTENLALAIDPSRKMDLLIVSTSHEKDIVEKLKAMNLNVDGPLNSNKRSGIRTSIKGVWEILRYF